MASRRMIPRYPRYYGRSRRVLLSAFLGGETETPDYTGSTLTSSVFALTANGSATTTLEATVYRTVDEVATLAPNETVAYTVSRTSVSASLSSVSATGTITDNGTDAATCTIVVRDSNGIPLPGIPAASIVLAVSGTGNTVTQPTGVTDASGRISGSFVSTTAATKTVSWTVAGLAITETAAVVVSGTPSLYPNEPSGMTTLVDWDGTPRGTTDAFGVADFDAWYVDPTAPASNLEVITDVTNPTGSGSSLKLIWNNSYNPRAGQATANPLGTGDYSELYVGFYIRWDDLFASKIFYFGTPSVAGSELWVERGDLGRVRIVTQGFTGQGEIIDTNDPAPKGTGGVGALTDAATWYLVEMHLIAESTPGAGDGYARMWVDGNIIGTSTTAKWGTGNFGSIEWYADNNALPASGDYTQRLGGLYISGKA